MYHMLNLLASRHCCHKAHHEKMVTGCDAYGVVFASVSDAISKKAIFRGQIRFGLSVKQREILQVDARSGGVLSICAALTAITFSHLARHPPQSWTTSC